MSKKEDIKENLLNLNSYLQALLTALIALIGFTFRVFCDIIKTSLSVGIIGIVGIFALVFVVFVIQKKILRLRKELRALK